jgi:hypothetical protein
MATGADLDPRTAAGSRLGNAPELAGRNVLHLGCGRHYMPDAINVDRVAAEGVSPDLVHDLEVRPWPFPRDRFREVFATDVIEHLDDTLAVMEEIHRVCAHGAQVHLVVPHFSCVNAFADPTHRRFFTSKSFDYFTEGHAFGFYSDARFRSIRSEICFHPTLTNKIVWRLAKRFTEAYESRWAWMFPAWFLSVDLEVVKRPGPQTR